MIVRQPGTIHNRTRTPITNSTRKPQLKFVQRIDCSHKSMTQLPNRQQLPQKTITYDLSYNLIDHAAIDSTTLPSTQRLVLQHNKMIKLMIKGKQLIRSNSLTQLKQLHINDNRLSFVNLSALVKLQLLQCSNNSLQTIILPKLVDSPMSVIRANNNLLTNLQYQLFNGNPCDNLTELQVNGNRLHDLLLSISQPLNNLINRNSTPNIKKNRSNRSLCPSLLRLSCCNNFISSVQGLPSQLHQLYIDGNQLAADSITMDSLSQLNQLKVLYIDKLDGNSVVQYLSNKLSGCEITEIGNETGNSSLKDSPYKLYNGGDDEDESAINTMQNQNCGHLKIGSNESAEKLTLGDHQPQVSEIEYLNQSQSILPCLKNTVNNHQHSLPQNNAYTPTRLQMVALTPATHIDPYHQYLTRILHLSMFPPRPIRHGGKEVTSERVDAIENQSSPIENEYTLFSSMFKERGGVHYVRKAYKNSLYNPSYFRCLTYKDKNHNERINFVNKDWGKEQFDELCNGNYGLLNLNGMELSPRPNSFTCYHVLVRTQKKGDSAEGWKCLYLVETVHS